MANHENSEELSASSHHKDIEELIALNNRLSETLTRVDKVHAEEVARFAREVTGLAAERDAALAEVERLTKERDACRGEIATAAEALDCDSFAGDSPPVTMTHVADIPGLLTDAAVGRMNELAAAQAEVERLTQERDWMRKHWASTGEALQNSLAEVERMRPVVEQACKVRRPWQHSNSLELRELWRRAEDYTRANTPEPNAETGPIEALGSDDPPRSNGGVQCDMKRGPCACGAWHDGTEPAPDPKPEQGSNTHH